MAAAPVLVWFRNDLRLSLHGHSVTWKTMKSMHKHRPPAGFRTSDHPALRAAATGPPILLLHVLDAATPGAWRIGGVSR